MVISEVPVETELYDLLGVSPHAGEGAASFMVLTDELRLTCLH